MKPQPPSGKIIQVRPVTPDKYPVRGFCYAGDIFTGITVGRLRKQVMVICPHKDRPCPVEHLPFFIKCLGKEIPDHCILGVPPEKEEPRYEKVHREAPPHMGHGPHVNHGNCSPRHDAEHRVRRHEIVKVQARPAPKNHDVCNNEIHCHSGLAHRRAPEFSFREKEQIHCGGNPRNVMPHRKEPLAVNVLP